MIAADLRSGSVGEDGMKSSRGRYQLALFYRGGGEAEAPTIPKKLLNQSR